MYRKNKPRNYSARPTEYSANYDGGLEKIVVKEFTEEEKAGSDALKQQLLAGDMPYPYQRKYMKIDDITTMFRNLMEHRGEIIPVKFDIKRSPELTNSPLLKFSPNGNNSADAQQMGIPSYDSQYSTMNNISSWFSEQVRLDCKRSDQTESPVQFWQRHPREIAEFCEQKYGVFTLRSLRDTAYEMHFECTTFKPSLVVTFINYFRQFRQINSMLDISAGWGDRLIAAISQKIRYVGVDPNTRMHPCYEEIIRVLAPVANVDPANYTLICAPFESATLPVETFDLVLTSPPFFDLEEYSKETTQSDSGRDLNAWYNDFLIASLRKASNALNPNGYMVIYISDVKNRPHFILRMLRDLAKWRELTYLGCVVQFNTGEIVNGPAVGAQPFWIWRKNE